MSEFGNDGKKIGVYTYDFAEDGGATSTIDLSAKAGAFTLPDNALVMNVWMAVETACTSAGSAVISYGNTTDVDGYSGTAGAVATFVLDYIQNGSTVAAALLWDDTNDHLTGFLANASDDRDFSITIATAALTAGKIRFYVEYVSP